MKRNDLFQTTISKEVEIKGRGLLSGRKISLKFIPSSSQGVVFRRTDIREGPLVPASCDFAHHEFSSTVLEKEGIKIRVTEHLLAALSGLGIDNLIIEIDGDEPPIMDGSALPFVEVLEEAGIKELKEKKEVWEPSSPLFVQEGDSYILIIPSSLNKIGYLLDFPHPLLSRLYSEFSLDRKTFIEEIAPARTFGFQEKVQPLIEKGFYKGGNLENTVLLDKEKVISPSLRFPDEFLRHKILDLWGDLFLSGKRLRGVFVKAVKTGHSLNIKMAKQIKKGGNMEKEMGVEEIMEILPHREPFLFVDKILAKGEKRIVGVKNVTYNEAFFPGHFPGYPIMPAVIMLESMAQVAGVLLLSRSENRGKIAYFTGIEKAKFRKLVRPGDQLIIEVEILKLKSRTGKVKAQASVEGVRVVEAEFLFSLAER